MALPYGERLSPWVNSVANLPDGTIAFGTSHGLSFWDGKNLELFTGPHFEPIVAGGGRFGGQDVPGNSPLPSDDVQDLLVARDGKLWIATNRGLAWYQHDKFEDVTRRLPTTGDVRDQVWSRQGNQGHLVRGPALGQDIWKLFQRRDGRIIVGTRNAGVILYDPVQDVFTLVHSAPQMNQWVTSIAEDPAGTVWIAVRGLGVLRYANDRVERLPFPAAWGPAADVRAIGIGPGGDVWIGTVHGLFIRSPDGRTREIPVRDLPDPFVLKLAVDRAGHVWASTAEGVAVYRQGAWAYPEFAGGERSGYDLIAPLPDGDLWVGVEDGLVRDPHILWHKTPGVVRDLEKAQAKIAREYPRVVEDNLTSVDPEKRVWLGYRQSLWRFDGHRWTDLTAKINRPVGSVAFVKRDPRGRIWVGTPGKGVYRFQGDRVDAFFNEENNAISVIYCMAAAKDGAVYIGTQHGMYGFQGDEPATISSRYQVQNLLVDGNGRVWGSDYNFGLLLYAGKELQELSLDSELAGWHVLSISLVNPDTVLVEAQSYDAEGTHKATFACDGKTVKRVSGGKGTHNNGI